MPHYSKFPTSNSLHKHLRLGYFSYLSFFFIWAISMEISCSQLLLRNPKTRGSRQSDASGFGARPWGRYAAGIRNSYTKKQMLARNIWHCRRSYFCLWSFFHLFQRDWECLHQLFLPYPFPANSVSFTTPIFACIIAVTKAGRLLWWSSPIFITRNVMNRNNREDDESLDIASILKEFLWGVSWLLLLVYESV